MEEKRNPFKNKFVSEKKKEKYSRDDIQKYPYDFVDLKIKKNKSLYDNDKTLLNFIMNKNKFKSHFDRKGAKKFLNEKTKAMEEIVLMDEIKEKKTEKLHKNSKKSKSHNKNTQKRINLKQSLSQNKLVCLEKYNFSKKQVVYEENKNANKSNSFVSFENPNDFKNNIENQNISKQKGVVESTKNKNKLSTININEPSFLMIGESDSFIYSIIKEMNGCKNYI
jgi:uncharacterized membrane protein YfhO